MLAPLRFLWNATRGHRLAPWRSPYLRWRLETFSGLHAETMSAAEMGRVVWQSRGQFFRFLLWTAQLQREARHG